MGGGTMRIIAFVIDPAPVHAILVHLGLPPRPPALAPARAPPQAELDFDQSPAFDPAAPELIPEFELDQSLPD